MLKDNYERLIQINKKLQLNTNDKEYALKIQLEELRSGYEQTKKENVKLKDNLETQNKLWKMWILKFEEQPKEVNSKSETAPENVVNNDDDDEILLVEVPSSCFFCWTKSLFVLTCACHHSSSSCPSFE